MASGGPSAQQQYMLELVNLARTNPAAIAERVTTNLDADVKATISHYQVNLDQVRSAISSLPAKPPLAWNSGLAQAAQDHSQDQANTGVQSHAGSDGSDLGTRLDRAGYENRTTAGENAFAYSKSVDEAMEAFMIDWGVPDNGHRNNILQPDTSQDNSYRDVGIGIVDTKSTSVGPVVITQNFGAQANAKPQLLGVAYNDPDHENFYEPGQGRGDVTIDAVNQATGATSSVQTWDSGGYQIPLDPGSYKVTARVGDQVVRTQDVNIGNTNVKVDYDLSEPWQGPAAAPAAPPATPPQSEAPTLMMLTRSDAPSPSTPPDNASQSSDAAPAVVPNTETAADAPVTTLAYSSGAADSASASNSDQTFQANTVSDHTPIAPPTSPFDGDWMTWKAKKSA